MSQAAPAGRATPRASVAAQPAPEAGTASSNGLPEENPRVATAPPLSASDSNGASVAGPGQSLSNGKCRTWPPSVSAPEQLSGWLRQMTALVSVVVPAACVIPPPRPAVPGRPL